MFSALNFLAFTSFAAAIVQGVNISNVEISTKNTVNCDRYTLFYQELQCTPQGTNEQGCPKSYTCPTYTTGSNFCRYQGVKYNIGESIPSSITPACRFSCFCSQNYQGQNILSCAQPRCFSGNTEDPDCYSSYSTINSCCASNEVCAPFESGACTVGNKVYHLNERYAPPNTCLICICKDNGHGLAVSECQKQICGLEIRDSKKIEKKCALLYTASGTGCCPNEIVCTEDLQNVNVHISTSTTDTCQFESQIFPIGGKIIADRLGSQIECTCKIPPLLTCRHLN